MSTGLCLVTRGMICVPRTAEVLPLVSCDEPAIQEALEVRPRMRLVSAPPVPTLVPSIVAGADLRPAVKRADSPTIVADPKPTPRILVELKPVIKDADED